MRDMVEALGLEGDKTFTREQALEWLRQRYPKIKPGTVTAHLIQLSTNASSRRHFRVKPGEDDLFYQVDRARFRLHSPETDPPPI